MTNNPLPVDCQFVAIWLTEDGLPFSATLRWHGGQLESYNYAIDDWDAECDHGFSVSFLKSVNALFFTDSHIKKNGCQHDYDTQPDGTENNKCYKCGVFK